MPEIKVLTRDQLPTGTKKTVEIAGKKVLIVHTDAGVLHAVEGECPHAKAPLEKGAVCNGRLVCPWHMGTFELATGALVEPPPLRALHTYPVRWNGDDVWVDASPRPAPAPVRIGEGTRVVLIGSGAAAAAAVTTLRAEGFCGTLTAVDAVAGEPIDRTVLTKMALSGEAPLEKAAIWSAAERTKLALESVIGRVTKLGARALEVEGHTLPFDYALVAPGGKPKKLGIPGEDLGHVFSIRHAADVAALDKRLVAMAAGKRVVIVGDGFIAFEAASALRARKLPVTILARAKAPFEKRLGPELASALVALHREGGVEVRLGVEARAIQPTGIELDDGSMQTAGIVIVAIGVDPATDFDHSLRTNEAGGFEVGRDLRASERVWVAGDAVTVDGAHIEHWRLAEQHGRTAAFGILQALGRTDERAQLAGVPFFWTLHFGKRIGYVGHAAEWDHIEIDGDLGAWSFLAYFVKDEAVAAVAGCGRDADLARLAEQLRARTTLDEARSQ